MNALQTSSPSQAAPALAAAAPHVSPNRATWAPPHLVTVTIDEEHTCIALDTGDECCLCELRLGTRRLRHAWQSSAQVTEQEMESMIDWSCTLIRPLLEPLRRSQPLELIFNGAPALHTALILGRRECAATDRHRISIHALADWQRRFDPGEPHTRATQDVLTAVILMRAVLDAAQLDTALVVGKGLC